jgi:hypothetical protein
MDYGSGANTVAQWLAYSPGIERLGDSTVGYPFSAQAALRSSGPAPEVGIPGEYQRVSSTGGMR